MTIVLTDMFGKEFTEGDRVVYAAANGIRVGKVEWIKQINPIWHRVYINLAEHNAATGVTHMRAKKMGYDHKTGQYQETQQYFLKV